MSAIEPGWYKDPAEPTTQRYWDGEGWLGEPLSADATPPSGPPPVAPPKAPLAPAAPGSPAAATPSVTRPAGQASSVAAPTAPASAPPSLGPGGYPVPGPGGGGAWPPGYPYPMMRPAEPRPHGLMLASAGSRFVARIVDVLVVLVLVAIADAWFAVQYWHDIQPYLSGVMGLVEAGQTNVDSLPPPPDSASLLPLLMSVVATAVWFAYEVPASANSGQTLGKRLLGIRVVRLESEEQLGFGRSFRRWSRLGLPTLFWGLCCGLTFGLQVVDCLFVVIDKPLRQALHDKSAATVVIQVPRPGRPETAPTTVTTGGRHADPS